MTNENKKTEQTEQNIEELLKNASKTVEEKIETKKKKNNKKPILWASVGAGAFLTIFVAAGLITSKDNQEFVDNTKDPAWLTEEKKEETKKERFEQWDYEYPVELEDWTKQKYTTELWFDAEFSKTLITNADKYQMVRSSLSVVPSGQGYKVKDKSSQLAKPYTNDISKMLDENGEENSKFSYALREDYKKAFSVYTQYFLNPVFGGWVQNQANGEPAKENLRFSTFKDIFAPNWWNNNIKEYEDYSKLPILADWNGDQFGGQPLAKDIKTHNGVFYGVIKETESNKISNKIIGMDKKDMPIIEYTIPVEFYAFGANNSTIKESGTLVLALQSNEENQSEELRVIVSKASLTLK